MSQPMILVTGATGNVGRPLIAGLLAEGARVRALTRNPAAAALPPEVEVSGGDSTRPGVFAGALRGADAVFINIGAIRSGLGDLLASAHDAGVSKIVLLSSTTVRDQGEQVHALGTQHKMAEDAIKASGIDWTIPRCGGFATNTLAWAATVRTDGVVRAPYGQAATALIAEHDIAAAVVRALLDPGHGGQTYYLTGQESLTQIQQAAAIGAAIGGRCASRSCPPRCSGSTPPSASRHRRGRSPAELGPVRREDRRHGTRPREDHWTAGHQLRAVGRPARRRLPLTPRQRRNARRAA